MVTGTPADMRSSATNPLDRRADQTGAKRGTAFGREANAIYRKIPSGLPRCRPGKRRHNQRGQASSVGDSASSETCGRTSGRGQFVKTFHVADITPQGEVRTVEPYDYASLERVPGATDLIASV